MRPYDAIDTDQLVRMESDNHPGEPEKWSILHNGPYVSLHKPHGGGWISIPTQEFNEIVDWYMAEQKMRPLTGKE